MKTIKNLLLVVAITFSSVLFGSTGPKTEDPLSLREEIIELLKSPNFKHEKDLEAVVRITFNRNKEIVVLSVDTENTLFKNFIKNRLNYTKVSNAVLIKKDRYILPVKLTAK